eukprot:TRINITY_DN5062_c0_g1_i2.p2 TRINITY_DN5062_c0_g1~~TRINITY_DN5062_c0_g1_i2.p2  ORF type:complete len:200 (+),score=50.15 TRINITY_DN5062_c0_g1_i2:2124-2723(+)
MVTKEMKCKTIIATAAMSALCKSLIKVCATEGIDVIGVIRKKEDLKTPLDLGFKHALNLTSPAFEKDLREIAAKTDARIAFDAIAGDMPGKLLSAMPSNSTVFVYDLLSGKPSSVDSLKDQLEKENKKLQRFSVFECKVIKDPEERRKAFDYIQKDVEEGGKLFKINVLEKFTLDEFKTAFETYAKVASTGKIIITPNP